MITVKKAQEKIIINNIFIDSQTLPLKKAVNRICSSDVITTVPYPLFDQSAVDGYAVKLNKTLLTSPLKLKVIGEIKAGDYPDFKLKVNEAVRIFTGALVPSGCYAVVMQEDVRKADNFIHIKYIPDKDANIRRKGKLFIKGQAAIKKGSRINAASIGVLASLGIDKIRVSNTPNIGIISTGDEFTKKEVLKPGKIYESNSKMLCALLNDLNMKAGVYWCKDDIAKLKKVVSNLLSHADIILITGGVSVGDYDYTKAVLEMLNFKIIFHNVLQKPGKPLLFAKKENKIAFGLPGNPRSVLVCFYEYVYPCIFSLMGSSKPFLQKLYLPLSRGYSKVNEKALFLAGKILNDKITVSSEEESHILKSFLDSDGIIFLPEGKRNYNAGDKVEFHLIPC